MNHTAEPPTATTAVTTPKKSPRKLETLTVEIPRRNRADVSPLHSGASGVVAKVPIPFRIKDYLEKHFATRPECRENFDRDVENHFAILSYGFFSDDDELREAGRSGIVKLWLKERENVNFRNGKLAVLDVLYSNPRTFNRLKIMAVHAGTTVLKLQQIAVLKAFWARKEGELYWAAMKMREAQ